MTSSLWLPTRRSFLTGLPAALVTGVTSRAAASRVLNVRDFGAIGDGLIDDTQAVRRAQAAAAATGSVLDFPTGSYSVIGWKDVSNDAVRWRSSGAATIVCHQRDILLSSRVIPLIISGNVRRASTQIPHKNADVPIGSIVFVSSSSVVDLRRPDAGVCQTVRVRSSNFRSIEIDCPLHFDFAESDANLQCRLYSSPRRVSISGIRFVTALDNPIRAISLVGIEEGLAFADCTFETENRGDINRASDGVMVMESIGIAAERLTISNCRYGYMLTNGARECTVAGVHAVANRHPIYPAYWASNCAFRDIVGINNVATVDSHSAFDIAYRNVNAGSDIEMSNIRSAGMRLENSKIRCREGGSFKVAFQSWVPRYQEIADNYSAVFRNVSLDIEDGVKTDEVCIWTGPIASLLVDNVKTSPDHLMISIDRNMRPGAVQTKSCAAKIERRE